MLMNGGGQLVFQQDDEAEDDNQDEQEDMMDEKRLDANGDPCCGHDEEQEECLQSNLQVQRDLNGVSLESGVDLDGITEQQGHQDHSPEAPVMLRLTLSDGTVISTGISNDPAESNASSASLPRPRYTEQKKNNIPI
jgi:hypothetical protein